MICRLLALSTVLLALAAPAQAGDYDTTVAVVFPSGHLRSTHVNPYPQSKRSAAVWAADACFKDCTSHAALAYRDARRTIGDEFGRARLDATNRGCMITCRQKGGPLFAEFPELFFQR